MTPEELFSSCCGADAVRRYREIKRCPECKESCDFVTWDDGEPVQTDDRGMVKFDPKPAEIVAVIVGFSLMVFYWGITQ